MSRALAFVRAHRAWSMFAGAILAAVMVFIVVWFQPQKLIIDKSVNEAAPVASSSPGSTSASTVVVAAGRFRSLEHHTVGRAQLLRLANGPLVLRLDHFETSNGPDVRVYLSEIPADRGLHAYGERFVDLGALKGNRGDQNYRVPQDVDPSRFKSVVVWCRRFTVGFGVAPLT